MSGGVCYNCHKELPGGYGVCEGECARRWAAWEAHVEGRDGCPRRCWTCGGKHNRRGNYCAKKCALERQRYLRSSAAKIISCDGPPPLYNFWTQEYRILHPAAHIKDWDACKQKTLF